MEYSEECVVGAAHPSLPGHFPGHPVVPGVVLLDSVLSALQRRFGAVTVVGLPQVKFLEPLLPAQTFTITLHSDDTLRIRFQCVREARTIASGQIQVAQPNE